MSKGERTREYLVARAAQVFSRQGYAGASLSDIMRATGLEKGGVYHHFADKDALALAAFDYAVGLLRERIQVALDGQARERATAPDRLRAYLDGFRSLVERPPLAGGCPLLNTAVEADDTHPALRRRVREEFTRLRAELRAVVERGVAARELRDDVDGEVVATVLLAAIEGSVMLSKLYRDPAYSQRVIAHLDAYITSITSITLSQQ